MHPRTTRGSLVLAAALAAASLLTGARAFATVEGGAALPPEPTVCDSVLLVARGSLPNPCYSIRGFRVGEPEPLPTMGPIPVYRIVGVILAEEPNPALDVACPTVIEPYRVSKELGKLPFGRYQVELMEYLHPFPADSTAPIDSSRAYASFSVGADSCRTGAGCARFGFAASNATGDRIDPCTARVAPGGRACFDVTLMNEAPVGAFQTSVALPPGEAFIYDFTNLIVPVSVTTTARTQGFQTAWTLDGTNTKILVYSTSGAVLQPGSGPVLHLCYDVKEGLPIRAYDIAFGPTLVSTPREEIVPLCPTFREVRGRLCVDEGGCDVNGDGVSDVRDIVRMVGCILSPPGACPDSMHAGLDCNDDASVDVRDVVCCARHILTRFGAWAPDAGPITAPPEDLARVGFEGEATWTSPLDGHGVIAIERGRLFGGLQFILMPRGAARVGGVSLADPNGAYGLLWEPVSDGTTKVMVYPRGFIEATPSAGAATSETAPLRLNLRLESVASAWPNGGVSIHAFRGATYDGAPLAVRGGATDLYVPASPVGAVALILPARPNPFVSDTEISFALPADARASLRLFDVRGRLVRTLHDGSATAGVHRVRWDGRDDHGRDAGVGIYFARFTSGKLVRTERILRLR